MKTSPYSATRRSGNIDLSSIFSNPRQGQPEMASPGQVEASVGGQLPDLGLPAATMPSSLPEIGMPAGDGVNRYMQLIRETMDRKPNEWMPKRPLWEMLAK